MTTRVSLIAFVTPLVALLGGACSSSGGASQRWTVPLSDPGPPIDPDADGTVTVTLHPNHDSAIGDPIMAAFSVPFPRGLLGDIDRLAVADADGLEIPVHAEVLATWRTLGGERDSDGSVRAALLYIPVQFPDEQPVEIQVAWDAKRTRDFEPVASATETWVTLRADDYRDSLPEPLVYATLPPEWLGNCELRTVTTPVGYDPDWSWFDEFFVGAASTATNDLPHENVEYIDLEDNAPWLFDRAMTLFGVYVRTGDVRWLRHAHRAARFYLRHLGDDGFFDYKPGDYMYVYGQSLLTDMILTGDDSLLEPIERVARTQERWNPAYAPGRNFFNERHQTYALLGALVAWEATGAPEHAARVEEIIEASFALAADPPNGWNRDGCLLHELSAHGDAGGDDPTCSPWMSALFADAVWRYYRHSLDEDALTFLANLGEFVARYGVYEGPFEDHEYVVPWYLASSVHQESSGGVDYDIEHTCDVAGLVARGAWARQQLGDDPSLLVGTTLDLLRSCRANLAFWHRPSSPERDRPEWRLSPPRKFSWWFGTSSDLPWLLAGMGISPNDGL